MTFHTVPRKHGLHFRKNYDTGQRTYIILQINQDREGCYLMAVSDEVFRPKCAQPIFADIRGLA